MNVTDGRTDRRHTMAVPFRAIAWDGKNQTVLLHSIVQKQLYIHPYSPRKIT